MNNPAGTLLMNGYLMPSQCDQCVVTVIHGDYVTHYAHETECIHARKDHVK